MIDDNEVVRDVEVSGSDDGTGASVFDTEIVVLPNEEMVDSAHVRSEADGSAAESAIGYKVLTDAMSELTGEVPEEEYVTYEVLEVPAEEPRLFFDTPFGEYSPTEGLLLLIFFLSFVKTVIGIARG